MHWRRWFAQNRQDPPTRLTEQLRREICSSFDRESRKFPVTIEPWRMPHGRLLLETLGDLAGKRVLDVGCGTGRFARLIAERHPSALVWGLDISQKMLRRVPEHIYSCAGSMTELPFRDECFDAVYAIESLEHAVEIDLAIRELCRVVKSGGDIVIIDKNAEEAGRFKVPYWEKWFAQAELEELLRRHSSRVVSQFLPHVAPGDRLFIAWLARK